VAHVETIVSYNLRTLHGAFLGVDERTRLLLDVHTLAATLQAYAIGLALARRDL
jgi:hypothetical protein